MAVPPPSWSRDLVRFSWQVSFWHFPSWTTRSSNPYVLFSTFLVPHVLLPCKTRVSITEDPVLLGGAGPSVSKEVNVCSYARNVRKKVSSSQPVAGIAVILLPEKTSFMNGRHIDQPVLKKTSPPAGAVTVIGFYKPVNRLFSPFLIRGLFRGFSRQCSGNPRGRGTLHLQDMRTGNRESHPRSAGSSQERGK